MSTGLFGLKTCPSGNRGPKNKGEVMLAEGNEGLMEIINLGFIPCPVCKPENNDNFPSEQVVEKVKEMYSLDSVADFCNKAKLPFDARRLNWQMITVLTEGFPSRIYLPSGLNQEAVDYFQERFFIETGSQLPKIGFYDASSPTRFTEYEVKR